MTCPAFLLVLACSRSPLDLLNRRMPDGDYLINFVAEGRAPTHEERARAKEYIFGDSDAPEDPYLVGYAMAESDAGNRSSVRSLSVDSDWWVWRDVFTNSRGERIEQVNAHDSRGHWTGLHDTSHPLTLILDPGQANPPLTWTVGILREYEGLRRLLFELHSISAEQRAACCAGPPGIELDSALEEVMSDPDVLVLFPPGASQLGARIHLECRCSDPDGPALAVSFLDSNDLVYAKTTVEWSADEKLAAITRRFFLPGKSIELFTYRYEVASWSSRDDPGTLRFNPTPGTSVLDERFGEPRIHYLVDDAGKIPSDEEVRAAKRQLNGTTKD